MAGNGNTSQERVTAATKRYGQSSDKKPGNFLFYPFSKGEEISQLRLMKSVGMLRYQKVAVSLLKFGSVAKGLLSSSNY